MNSAIKEGSGKIKSGLWTHDFTILVLIAFFNMMCMQFNTATLSSWVASLGFGSSYTGLLNLCFTLPNIACSLIWGKLSQKTGRRIFLIAGSAMFCIGSIFTPILAMSGLGMIIVLKIIQGVGYSAVNNGMSSTQGDVIPQNRLGEGMGYFGIAQSLTLIIGPAAALFIVGHAGFTLQFISMAVMCLIVLVMGILLKTDISAQAIRKSIESEDTASVKKEKGLWILFERTSVYPCFLLLISMAALSSTNFYVATYAETVSGASSSLFFVVYAIADAGIIAFIKKLSDRLSMEALVIPGMVIGAAGIFWLSAATGPVSFLLSAIPIGVGTGMIVPVINAAAFRGVLKHRRGMAAATYYIGFDGGMCLGSILWGILIDISGFTVMYHCAAILLLAVAAVSMIVKFVFRRSR